jgi:HPt (histidine-containing phosphotransfer) domain-containing protein
LADPVIDPATFDALKDMAGPEFAAELVATFFEEAPTMIADLESAAGAHEADRFRRAAHSLKSNCMTFGALELAGMAKALELGGIGANTSADVAAIEAEYARVVVALKEITGG